MDVRGKVHSIQSLGTVDGPGVRFVVFMQGCPLRCACCHNPDTWDVNGGTVYAAEDLVAKAIRYTPYFGKQGGVTLSGGEPLMQAAFAGAFFRLCHEKQLHTCLDTSGWALTEDVKNALSHCDRVLLDVKYTSDADYQKYVGCGLARALDFLAYLNAQKIPVTLRQVVIPTLNDHGENVQALLEIAKQHPVVDGIELLPFRKICMTKYDMMGIPFPLAHIPEPSREQMEALKRMLGPYAR